MFSTRSHRSIFVCLAGVVSYGGSLSNFEIRGEQRTIIHDKALDVLTQSNPDVLVTACPAYKKTIQKGQTRVQVKDIA